MHYLNNNDLRLCNCNKENDHNFFAPSTFLVRCYIVYEAFTKFYALNHYDKKIIITGNSTVGFSRPFRQNIAINNWNNCDTQYKFQSLARLWNIIGGKKKHWRWKWSGEKSPFSFALKLKHCIECSTNNTTTTIRKRDD